MDGFCTKFRISKFPGYTPLHCPVNKMYETGLPLKISKLQRCEKSSGQVFSE